MNPVQVRLVTSTGVVQSCRSKVVGPDGRDTVGAPEGSLCGVGDTEGFLHVQRRLSFSFLGKVLRVGAAIDQYDVVVVLCSGGKFIQELVEIGKVEV